MQGLLDIESAIISGNDDVSMDIRLATVARRRSRCDRSRSQAAPCDGREQLAPHLIEISQCEHGLRPRQVFGQAAIAHLGEAPQLFNTRKGVLAAGSSARTRPVDHTPALAQRSLGVGAPIDPVAYPPRLKELAVVFLPVRLVTEDLALLPMQQFGKLSDIGYRRIGRAHGVDDATLVGADMQLHPEVPIPPLPSLLHLGVAS